MAFNTYVMTLVWPMLAAGESITMVSQGNASWKRVKSLFAETPEVADDGHTNRSITEIGSGITCRNLHFRYADGLPEVFSGFSAEIPEGATIGILGRTGCGKSTLVSLLTRLYNVEPGQIFIGGQDIRQHSHWGASGAHCLCAPGKSAVFRHHSGEYCLWNPYH